MPHVSKLGGRIKQWKVLAQLSEAQSRPASTVAGKSASPRHPGGCLIPLSPAQGDLKATLSLLERKIPSVWRDVEDTPALN